MIVGDGFPWSGGAAGLRALRPADRAPRMEQDALRKVMSLFATGVTVLTAGGENSHGMTANSFASVSLDPLLVLCCVARTAGMHEAILSTRSFAVTILAADQMHLARHFADKRRPRGPAQFESVDCHPGPRTGAPLLDGALAWLECRLATAHDGGDHSIFVGEVLGSGRGPGTRALSFFGGDYHELDAPRRASA